MVDRFVMPSTERRLHRRFGRFWFINNSLVPVHLAVLAGLVQGLGVHLLVANAIAIGAVFVLRYVTTSRWVYGQRDLMSTAAMRKAAVAGRRSVQIRFALAFALTLAAFPAAVMSTWGGVLDRGAHLPLLIPLAAAGALLVGRLKPAHAEPNVHDRQVDGLIAAALLLTATTLAALAPDRHATSTWVVLAMVSFLAGATVLLLGTRTAARLRWTLVLPLVAVDEATPPAATQALQRLGGAPFFEALVCLLLAALSCYGLTRRFAIGTAISLPTLAAVALVVRPVADRLEVADSGMASPPFVTDAALAVTVAAFAWWWSANVAVQRADGLHYVPRGRLAFTVLAVVALLLAVPGSPILSAVNLPGTSVDAGGGAP
jgi:putative flippase GtrA